MYNLDLSQQRAFSVVKYILSDRFPNFKYKDRLQVKISAVGRSESIPLLDESGNPDWERSRRVEFKFRLEDEKRLKKIAEKLDQL